MLELRSSKSASFAASSRPSAASAADHDPLFTGAGSEVERLRTVIAQLRRTTACDPLTGLPTRGVLLERLERELAREDADGAEIAVLFVDLDNFKLVNDSLGHRSGDEVLCEMAKRISGCLAPEDTPSRFGGDEMVILHSRATGDTAVALGNRILRAFAEPILVSGKEVVVSASVGIAQCRPGTKTTEQLLREADTALYAAKDRGRARLEQFDEELHARAEKRMQIESDLRAALRQSQLFVEYQPQVRLKDGCVVGVEALVRWRHPELGIIAPSDFIPVAEECGLIVKIGRQVLRESCRQLAEWTRLIPGRPLAMTVNVSPRQIAEADFIAELREVLAATGIDPAALCLEVTESVMMSARQEVIRQLGEIRQLGIFIAIDDFGTEHSSLSRLREMPAEVLKIDRSFIDGLSSEPGDTAIVSSILSLAYAMGKHTIAEGVEKREQAAMLLRMGCEVGQGYFFSRPVAAEEIVPMLTTPLWQPRCATALHSAHSTEGRARRGHRYFVDEFLEHIGAPMGTKVAGPP